MGEPDRILLWTRPNRNSSSGSSSNAPSSSSEPDYHMYWMQDASDEKDDEIIAKLNQYLADPDSGNPNASSSSSSSNSAGAGGSGSGSGSAGDRSGATTRGTETSTA